MIYVPPHLRNKNNNSDNNNNNNNWSNKPSYHSKSREESSEIEELLDEQTYYKSTEEETIEEDKTRAKVNCNTKLTPLYDFNRLKLPNNMFNYLKDMKPTEIQTYSIPAIFKNKNVMCRAPTGVGKTLAFLVPLMLKLKYTKKPKLRVLILTPTRELAIQIKNEADKLVKQQSGKNNIYVESKSLYGGTPVGLSISQLSRGCDILIATPGRLVDFIKRGIVTMKNVKYFVLDEADRMLDMGFERDMNVIKGYMKKDILTYLFSATFDRKIMKIVNEYLGNDRIVIEYENETIKNIKQEFVFTKRNKEQKLLENLKSNECQVLVFVERKNTCRHLEAFLHNNRIKAVSLHGDKMQSEREYALQNFVDKRAQVLVATSVAARGLHIPNINLVINYDMPGNVKDYIHRIGRSGRCGNNGRSVSFFEEKDFVLQDELIAILKESDNEVPSFMRREERDVIEIEQKVKYMSLEKKYTKKGWGGL